MAEIAHPPATLEGWYALHQLFSIDHAALRATPPTELPSLKDRAASALRELTTSPPDGGGWSAVVPLIGSRADVMLVHFRTTLEGIAAVQRTVSALPIAPILRPAYTFLSVTELGLYHVTAELSREAAARGGAVGDDVFRSALEDRVEAERRSAHAQRRLYPERPPEMPYVCFYPMSKRRVPGQNWYALTLEERSQLMHAHSKTGRQYAGRVLQIVSGAIGLDAWEWGVTLFARDPLDFKKIVTDMRFDEVSALYAEFGEFFVGKVGEPGEWLGGL